ncbi:hypothetical protein AMTR_s00076p00095550 [Amborella trichopoda]|uniref:HMA domain-containing protein n=2 Tax=Amborella trichopoda TaxID=13333 RepID=W1PAQ8_AMBTC|nr:hypothetical protein AMTR_s00076p00095550 [Amborella trichopoda]
MSVVEVLVKNMDCCGCTAKIEKALFRLKGVEAVEVDMEMHKVTVRGYSIEEKKIVKAINKTGKVAEPWPFPQYSSHVSSFYKFPSHVAEQYYDISQGTAAAHTFFHTPAAYSVALASDEAAASLFSDENPHACTIM